jgi:hypothetical protein
MRGGLLKPSSFVFYTGFCFTKVTTKKISFRIWYSPPWFQGRKKIGESGVSFLGNEMDVNSSVYKKTSAVFDEIEAFFTSDPTCS